MGTANNRIFLPLLVFLLTIFASEAQNNVIITNIIPNVNSGDPLIEHVDGHSVTAQFTIGTTAGSDSLIGANLWSLSFYIADSSENLVTGTRVDATLTNPNVGVTPGQTFTLEGTANLNLDSKDCSQLPKFCATLSVNPSASPAFTLTPDTGYSTTKCTDISCEGVVITNVLPAQTEDRSLIQGTDNINVNLTVTLSSDTNYASIQGTGLWKAFAFLNSEVDGTGSRLQSAAVDMLDSDDYGLDNNGMSVWPKIQADFDLTDLSCADFDYVCVEVQQGDRPAPDFTLTYQPSTADVGCAQIQCTGLEILSGATLTITAGFLEDRSTTVVFDVSYPTGNAGVTGDNLWDVNVYASANADGSGTRISSEQVALSTANAGMDIASVGDSLDLNSLSVTMDFSGQYCGDGNIMYLCAVLTKSSSASPDFEISPSSNTVCQAAPCTGVLISSVIPSTSDSILQNRESTISLDIDLTADSSAGSVSGTGLWDVEVFTSASDTTIAAVVTATVTVGSAENEDVTAGSTSTLTGITAVFDLTSQECIDVPFICVRVSRGSPSVNFQLNASSTLEGCFVPDCKGVTITSFRVMADNTPYITEYQTTMLTASVNLVVKTDSDDGSVINGLWKVLIYLSGNADCSGTENAIEEGDLSSQSTENLPAGNVVGFNGINASLNVSSLMCSDMEYICVNFTQNDGETFSLTPLVSTASDDTDCRGVLITSVAFTDSIEVIELSPASENSITITSLNVTSSSTGASITGMDLWEAIIFVNADDSTFPDTPVGSTEQLTNMNLAAGSTITFSGITTNIDMTGKTCLDNAMYICVKLQRQSSSNPEFKLSGSPTDSDLIGCQQVTCYGVYVTGTTLTITGGDEIIENSLSSQITFTLGITANDNRADVSGSNLWAVSSSIYSTDDFTNPELIPQQITTADDAISNGIGTITGAMVTFNVSTLICSEINFLCVMLAKGAEADPNFTLVPDPDNTAVRSCASLTCKGVIVDETSITAGDDPTNNWPIVEGKVQSVFLDVTVTRDTTSATISGEDLWIFTVFLSNASDGSGTKLYENDATLDMSQSTQGLTSGAPVEFTNIKVENWDLQSFLCNEADYICAEIKKNGAANPDFTFEGSTVGCMPLQCRGFEIAAMTLTVSVGDQIIEWQQGHAVNLSVLVDPDPTSAYTEGSSDLWDANIFFSPDPQGDGMRFGETSANNGAWEDVEFMSISSMTLSGVLATVNLNGSCDNLQYICIEILKSSTATFTFDESENENIACTQVTCTGVVVASSSLTIDSGTPVIEGGINQNVIVTANFVHDDQGADVSGTNLWEVVAFVSASASGDGTREATSDSRPTPVSNTFDDDNDLQFSSARVVINLNDVVCTAAKYLCVEVLENTDTIDAPSIDFTISGATVACTPLDCNGVIVTDTVLSVTTGEPILEREGNVDVTLSLAVTTSNAGAAVNGSDLWSLTVFTNNATDGQGAILFEKELPGTTDAGWTDVDFHPAGNTFMLNGISVTFDLTDIICPSIPYICLNLSKADSSSTSFTLDSNPVTALSDCVEIDCRGVVVDSLVLTLNSPDDEVVEHADSEEVNINFEVFAEANTVQISGENIWQLRVFLNNMSDGTGDSQGSEVIPNIGDSADESLGGSSQTSFTITSLAASVDAQNFVCPSMTYLCVELLKNPMAPQFALEFSEFISSIVCEEITCRGVELTQVTMVINEGGIVTEYIPSHVVTYTLRLLSAEGGATIVGSNLWEITTYLSADANGEGMRFAEKVAENGNYQDTNLPTEVTTHLLNVMSNLDVSGVACSDFQYFCAEVSRNPDSNPAFTLDPQPDSSISRVCTVIRCKGLQISNLDVAVEGGSPVIELTSSHIIMADITLQSDPEVDLNGTDWDVTLTLGSNDECSGSTVTANHVSMANVMVGESIVLEDVQGDFDLSTAYCDDLTYLCVQVMKSSTATPDFQTSSAFITGFTMIPCAGVIIDNVTLAVTGAVCEANMSFPLDLVVEFHLASNSRTFKDNEASNIWNLTLFTSPQSNGSIISGSATVVPLTAEELAYGVSTLTTRVFSLTDTPLNTYGLICDDMQYLCILASKRSDVTPDITISFPSDPSCIPVTCKGVVIDGDTGNLDSDNEIKEHSATNVTFDFEIESSASSAVLSGTDLWQFNVFVSANQDGSGEHYGETFASLSDEQKNTAITTAGSTLEFTGIAASLNLADLKCFDDPNTFYYLCVEFMRDPASTPTFSMTTVSGNPLTPYCAVANCSGVEITGTSVSTSSGDPVVERSNNTITFSMTVSSDANGASISGDNLWKLTADLKDRNGNNFTPEENVVISVSEASKDITAGTDIQLSDLTVTVDLTDFICPATVQLCVILEKNDAANPDFTFNPNTGVFPSCVDIDCEGVVITSSSLTESSGITFKEGASNQVVDLDLRFMVAEDAGGIDGSDQWAIEVFVNSESDGTGVMYSEVYGVLPQNVANIPAIPGENLDFSSVSATLDFSSPMYLPCGDIFYLCATLKMADTASKNFTLSGRPTDALLTACERKACEGVIVENTELTFTTDKPFVKEGSTETLEFNISMAPASDSSTLTTGETLWSVTAFGSSRSDGFGDRSAVVAVDTTGVGAVGVTPGSNTDLSLLSVDFDLSSISCSSFMYMCVEVSRNDAADPLFSLEGSPTGDALVGCSPIECIGVRVTNGTLDIESSAIPILEGLASFNVQLNVQFTTNATGADISGNDLWALQVFTSSSVTGTPATTPKVLGTLAGSSNSQPITAGESLTFNNLMAELNTTDMTCGDALFICAVLMRDAASVPEFTLNGYDEDVPEINDEKLTVCEPVTCQGVVITSSNLTIVEGSDIIEGDSSFSLIFDAVFTSDVNGGAVDGDGNWALQVFINDASDGSGDSFSTLANAILGSGADLNIAAGGTLKFDDVTVELDLSNIICKGLTTYLCVELMKGDSRDFSLEGIPDDSVLRVCREVTCVGVTIISSTLIVTAPSAVKENRVNTGVLVDLSMTAAALSANVSGPGLWSVTVFTNTDNTGMDVTHEFSTEITLTSGQAQEGVVSGRTTTLSDLTFSLDLDSASCESVPYICANISRNPSSSVEFTFTAENNAETACTVLPCNGVIITEIDLSGIPEQPVEHESSYQFRVQSLVITVSPESALLETGQRLWNYTFFPNTQPDGLGDSSGIEYLKPGVSYTIHNAGINIFPAPIVTFDLTSIECDQIPYICLTLSKGFNPTRSFTLQPDPDDSVLTTCIEVMCKGVEITDTALTINTGDAISEGDTSHLFDISAVFSVDPTGATISGTGLWQLTLYATRSSDGSGTRYLERPLTLGSKANNGISSNELRLLSLQTTVSLENELCANLMYLCVELGKGNSPQPQDFTLSGDLIGCQPLDCLGVYITDMTVTTSNSVLENSNNNDITLSVTLDSDASDRDSSINMWLISVFTSDKDFNDPTGSGVRVNEVSGSISQELEDQVLTAGTPLEFNPVAASLNIQTTCIDAAYVCVEVRQGTTIQPRVVLLGQTIGCTPITCRNVETTSTSASIARGGSVKEGEDSVDVAIDIVVQSDSNGASISGTDLWKISMFISSTDGEGGKIGTSETPLVLTMAQANAALTAGSPLEISDLEASLPLVGVTCNEALYICIDFRKGDSPTPAFSMSPMPDRATAQVGCAPVVNCRGIEVDSTSFSLDVGSPLVSAESNDLTFSVSLDIAHDSGTVSGENLWTLTFFPNSASDGSGPYTSSSTLVVPFAGNSEVIAGVTTGLDNVNGALDLTGVLCQNAQYLCLTVTKGNNPETDFTIEDASDLSTCSAVECIGVNVTATDLRIIGEFTILEDANSLPFGFALDVTSSSDGASVAGSDLWEVAVYLSANNEGTGTRVSELSATLDDASSSLMAGATIAISGSANLDLDGVICENVNHICAILSKSSSASPDFTLEDDNPQVFVSCKQFACEGVVITDTEVSVNQGDPILQLTEVFDVELDVTLTAADVSAEITGTGLWEVEVFISSNADGSGEKKGLADADLTSSQADTTVATGTSTTISGIGATLDLSDFKCNAVANYICVTIERASGASPLFSLEGQPDSALTNCVSVDCEGIKITGVGVTVISGSPMKEGSNSQELTFDVAVMSDALFAGINGDDLWAAEAFLSPVADGSQRTDFISASIPSNELNKDLIPGVTFSLEGLSGIFDISGKRCSEVMYLCVEIDKNAAAVPDFDFSDSQSLSDRTGCTEIRCLGIGIQQVLPDFDDTGVAEGDNQQMFTFDVEVFPWVESNTISGSNIWDLNVFVSLSNDDSTPRYAETLASLTQSQRDLMLSPPTALDFQGVSATLDLSSYTCDQYMYACVEVLKTGAEAQGITLGGYPNENDIIGCEQIMCASFDSEITITSYTDEKIEFTWTAAIGDFNAYEVRYTPTDGVTNSPAVISRSLDRMMDLEMLNSGQLYTIELRLLKNGLVKSTGVVTATQRTKPESVSIQADSGTTQEIQLSWNAAGGIFDEYIIEYTPNTGVPASPATIPKGDTSVLFSNLLPGRVYQFEIYTVSGAEESSRSTVNYATLPPDSTLSVSGFTTTTVSLIWSTPDGIDQNYQYRLTYSPDDPVNPVLNNPGVNSYTVNNLTPGRLYTFRLSVVAMDSGEELVGNEGVVSQRTSPSRVTTSTETTEETAFTIQWDPAAGDVDQYVLSYVIQGSSNVIDTTTVSAGTTLSFLAGTLNVAQGYTVTIITESGGLQSDPYTKLVSTRPYPPGAVASVDVTENEITISWVAAPAPVDGYLISYTPNEIGILPASPVSTSATQLSLSNIPPHTTVEYTIQTQRNGALSQPVVYRQRTFSKVPGPVMSFNVIKDKPYQVLVSFNAPSEPNGVITGYVISYYGTRNGETLGESYYTITAQPNHEVFQNIAISGLTPGYTYTFTITASNSKGQGDPVTQDGITLDIDPPLINVDSPDLVIVTASSDTTFTITIRSDLFSDLNGAVIAFVVMIREVTDSEDLTIPAPEVLPTYRTIEGNDVWGIYQSGPRRSWFSNGVQRRKRQAESIDTVDVVIGDEDPCRSSTEPCNGPLKTGTAWRYAIRGYNEEGEYSDTDWSSPVVTNHDPKIFNYIVAATVGFFVIIFFILIICIICSCNDDDLYTFNGKQPIENVVYGGPYNTNANNSTVVDVPQSKSSTSRRGRFSRPVANTRFANHFKSMSSTGRYKFSDEYEDLRTIGLEQTSVAGDLPENRYSNRYTNILPYDHNRVQISGAEDYINASFMTGITGDMEYVATQGPLPDTKNDFWRMIWDHNVPTIVMVGQCVEQGRVKCDHYWPFDQDSTSYGNITVTMTSETAMPEWVIREFTIEKDGVVRAVRHFNYTEWPAHGVPSETDAFMRFVRTIHAQSSPHAGPTVVHCSAGVGRTAVFIALDILSQQLVRQKPNDTIDIFGIVAQMRQERCYMIQTEAQYVFLHQAVLDLLQGKISGNNWFLMQKGKNLSNDLDAIQMEANILA
ncbi:uncharacterized protein LOC117114839 isoform X2 [Anneissia japonica]|uniref:uncharacterized protein LOC117114839 isoform X2 n=1 Tax=Anneissia japonica TaxID=1529436 RepID=UPI001425AB85|nr:uncharacterized protein LOC117114839 isoform X2 [Anneissia japonica]